MGASTMEVAAAPETAANSGATNTNAGNRSASAFNYDFIITAVVIVLAIPKEIPVIKSF